MVLNKSDFTQLSKQLESFQNEREVVILLSREIVKLSKQLIYAVQRKNNEQAHVAKKAIDAKYEEIQTQVKKSAKLFHVGAYKMAVQEYVEAVCYFELIQNNTLPTSDAFDTDPEYYLMGICDLTGELVREAINEAIKENFTTAEKMREIVSELYGEMLQFNFSGGELRKKFDSIKYDLNKLENVVYELKLKGKL